MPEDLFKTLQTIKLFSHYNRWLYDQMHPYLKGRVVDVGSGIGNVAYYFEDNQAVEKVILTDAFNHMLGELRRRFEGRSKFEVLACDICHPVPPDLRGTADTVTCVNVLEHIEDDRSALANMSDLLRPGGRLILMVPSLMSIYGTLDKLVGHHRRYTKPMLLGVIDPDLFQIEDLRYMNMLGVFSWFVSGRILRLRQFHPHACGTLDRMVPLIRKLETAFVPAFGQSLVAVCRRK